MSAAHSMTAEFLLHAERVHELLLRRLDPRRADVGGLSDRELHARAKLIVDDVLDGDARVPVDDRETLREYVLDEALGLGPIEALLRDPAVTEVMVNSADRIYVERNGRLERAASAFSSALALQRVVERVVAPIGRRVDEASLMVDARLLDGSRVNVVIPPLALRGPAITIRRFGATRLIAEDLLALQSLSPAMLEFLKICVAQRRNIVVSGGTGSGKTTLLNIISNLIPAHERVVTIEDAAELGLAHGNLVALEARPANLEGRGEVTIRDLVRNALRMRPNRIVVGECRGGEALDMLQAMNTGHDGSLTTAHANSPRDVLSRLEVMSLMAGVDIPVMALREQIAASIHIIVQQTRFACGARKITHISEITGMEGQRIQMQDLFRFEIEGWDSEGRVRGQYMACDQVPAFYEQLQRMHVAVDLSLFRSKMPRAAA